MKLQELSESINIKNFAVFGFIKINIKKDPGKDFLFVKDEGSFTDSKWKMSGGGPGKMEEKDFKKLKGIDFVKRVLQRKVFSETGILLDPEKMQVVFVKVIDGHSFVVMKAGLDFDSRRVPMVGEGVKDADLFSLEEVESMLKRSEILENHALALNEILNLN